MTESVNVPPPQPSLPEPKLRSEDISVPTAAEQATEERKQRLNAILAAIVGVLILAALIASVVLLVNAGPATAGLVRDIFIIFMGLISILVMIALVILIIQLAILINLLQNEIKPILRTTNETVNNLRGTTTFISNNLVEPIIKLNEYLAGLRRFFDLIRPGKS
ncbi:MAG: hypothetical protein LDL12_00765 [Anaerolinea sp.]|nr:hypothetical protein [Anaerolinea sp.]